MSSKATTQHLILVSGCLGHLLEDALEGYAAGRRRMLEDLLVKLVEDGISGGVHLAVDMHRNDIWEEWASISSKSLKRAVVLPVPGGPRQRALTGRAPCNAGRMQNLRLFICASRWRKCSGR